MFIFQGRTTNGASAVTQDSNFINSVFCWGVFAGATVILQGSTDNIEWFDLATFTAKGVIGVGVKCPYKRGFVSGATGTTNINLDIQ
jgi:hypothetical protein